MRKVPFKNYIFLIMIIAFTVFVTMLVANLYKDSKRVESDFYKYANTISNKEFDVYVTEYPDSIIYIYDKYSYQYKEFDSEKSENVVNRKYNNIEYKSNPNYEYLRNLFNTILKRNNTNIEKCLFSWIKSKW